MKKSSLNMFLSIFVIILTFVLFIMPVFVMADEKEPVKVYVFLAPDCGYCEKEIEYLESLETYNEKFVIVEKELFASIHSSQLGEDYELGEKVAEAFRNAGFRQANTSGTPFVVISDIYARTSYNDNLESVIEEAYEAGDKDIVKCIEDGNNECLPKSENNLSAKAMIVLSGSVIVIIGVIFAVALITNKKENN